MVELVPDSYVAQLDLPRIFGRHAPLHVDLGCGDGAFLAAMADRYPEENFLGIDRMPGRIDKACRRAVGLNNVRFLLIETSYAVRYLLPARSVETFYLLFPDPWPKRRHHDRRVATPDFFNSIHAALEDNGALRIATDQSDYFDQISRQAQTHFGFEIVDPAGTSAQADLPHTKFEKRFRSQGVPIHQLTLRKISPVT